jgi:hypothetical protein
MVYKRLVAMFLIVVLSLAIDNYFFDKLPSPVQKQPTGKVIAYYNNDYQRYAVDKLIQMDMLEQYPCLFELWTKESNWRPKARNKSSGALGIAQLMPATWVNIDTKPTLNGYKQVDAGLAYIERKYGKKGICRAYAHHLAKNWY